MTSPKTCAWCRSASRVRRVLVRHTAAELQLCQPCAAVQRELSLPPWRTSSEAADTGHLGVSPDRAMSAQRSA